MASTSLLRCTCARPASVAPVASALAAQRRHASNGIAFGKFSPELHSSKRLSPASGFAPYVLHAHVHNNNSIFTLSIAPANHPLARSSTGGTGSSEASAIERFYNAYPHGRTVGRASSGSVKSADGRGSNPFRNAARGSYEAQTQAALALLDKFDEVVRCAEENRVLPKPAPRPGRHAEKDRAWLAKRKCVRAASAPTLIGCRPFVPPMPSQVELVLSGFGQGREALIAALASPRGEAIRKGEFAGTTFKGSGIRLVRDATPIKRGGDRPRKQRRV